MNKYGVTVARAVVRTILTTTSSVSFDPDFITKIRDAYTTDPWCQKRMSASKGMSELTSRDGLWF